MARVNPPRRHTGRDPRRSPCDRDPCCAPP
jgi:hypothetical protein